VTWHHPTYYKKLRAERKKIPVSGMKDRETGPSKFKTVNWITNKKSSSYKPQAPKVSSSKQEASSPE